ncbi:MAG: hypothetical protein QOF92_3830 [Pseudonocardiales bacterium]|nr:hypothetical protein [Jatrophihabitans sp.]MDT4930963.1 hypothetical protein [Pseudonocardiales bacterium]
MITARSPLARRSAAASVALFAAVPLGLFFASPSAQAAKSDACAGGGFTVLGKSAAAGFTGTVAAPAGRFTVQGKYTRFDVSPADFAVYDQGFTGAANASDITGGRATPVFASKIPDHRGLVLTSAISLELKDTSLVISRTGPGLTMKLQANDCAQGGIFQMEVQRADQTRTRIVHRLAAGVFYFDNANFRAKLGQFLGADCQNAQTGPPSQFCVQVTPRVNIANNISSKFVLRDSTQVATRIRQAACGPDFTNTLGLADTRDQCGGMAIFDVASGGRLGMVTGEDGTEVANPPTVCVSQCQAQNQVRGRLANLGFPFPVPVASQLTPRVSTDGLTAPLTP